MKSTEVQTLGTVALHATTACTDDASIDGLSPLNWARVLSCLVLHVIGSVCVCRVCACMCMYYGPVPRLGPLLAHA